MAQRTTATNRKNRAKQAQDAQNLQQAQPNHVSSWTRLEITGLALILTLAAVLLLWHLDEKYLWQDEAATAVLSARLLKFGKPLGYDGINLITNDNFASEDLSTVDQRTRDPKAAVDYYIKRGDLKRDTSWKYQPWGQFIVTAASLKLFGQTTFAARLPFSLAAAATVLLLYLFVRKYFADPLMAFVAALFLVLSVYWILHSRQSRYYSLSSLFLVLTLLTYARWQWGRAPLGAFLFGIVAWCWFQVDYGTVWPVLAVLFLDALLGRRQGWRDPFVTGVALLVSILPFAYYYELWNRFSVQSRSWWERFQGNVFNMNEYVIPAVILIGAIGLVGVRWKKLAVRERRLVCAACAIIVAIVIWVPTVAPDSFLRYVTPIMPVAALLMAWTLTRAIQSHRVAVAVIGTAILAFTALASLPLRPFAPGPSRASADTLLRVEFATLASEIFGHPPDPNRIVVDFLKQNAAPTDEILINYEDIPLMFYLPNPVRGGIAAFRAEDDAKSPPRFLVIRRSVGFVHWPVFKRVVERYRWTEVPTKAPDVMWGNNPDPMGHIQDPTRANALLLARREGP